MGVLYNLFMYVVLPFLISFFAAWVFWILTFKYSSINIVFSDKLEKRMCDRIDGNEGQAFTYRIRLSNVGSRDLIEASIIAKVTTTREDGRVYATHFQVGDECVQPVIPRRKKDREIRRDKDYYPSESQMDVPKNYKVRYYTLHMWDVAYKEFSKEEYTSQIRDKAKAKTLVIDDIFEAYPDAKMIIYLFGNDSVTGARRKFESKEYCKEDIVEGRFRSIYEMEEGYRNLRKAWGRKRKQLMKRMLSEIGGR